MCRTLFFIDDDYTPFFYTIHLCILSIWTRGQRPSTGPSNFCTRHPMLLLLRSMECLLILKLSHRSSSKLLIQNYAASKSNFYQTCERHIRRIWTKSFSCFAAKIDGWIVTENHKLFYFRSEIAQRICICVSIETATLSA